jgi:hypothetical protein
MKYRNTTVVFRNGRPRKPVEDITDRAKRYRAHAADNKPLGPKQCGFCGRRRNVDAHHITGDESDGGRPGLMWACRSCNTSIAIRMREAGLGKPTNQFNPLRQKSFGYRRGTRREMLREYGNAIKVMRGDFEGDIGAAMDTIRSTPAELRAAYTSRTWPVRRAIYGESGRAQGKLFGDVPF